MGGDLDNPDRGIFHIEGAEFWEFYNLELINGPYELYSRDFSNNYYESLITRDKYQSGTLPALSILKDVLVIDLRLTNIQSVSRFQLEGEASNNTVLYFATHTETVTLVKTAKALTALRAKRDPAKAMFSVVQGHGTTLTMAWICGG